MDLFDYLIKTIMSGLAAFVVASYTAKYALNRFYIERWWDKKAEMYLQLLEVIHIEKKHAIYHHGVFMTERTGNDEYLVQFSEEEVKKLDEEHMTSEGKLTRFSDLAPLMLNNTCKQLIDQYIEYGYNLKNLHEYDGIDTGEAHESRLASTLSLLTSISEEACKELRHENKNEISITKLIHSLKSQLKKYQNNNK